VNYVGLAMLLSIKHYYWGDSEKAESGNDKMTIAIVLDRRKEVINMPNKDKAGPKGQGPKDGKGKGKDKKPGQDPITGGKKGNKKEPKK